MCQVELFGTHAFNIMDESLSWEVYEQQSLWSLLCAESQYRESSMDYEHFILHMLQNIDGDSDHTEVLSGIMSLMRSATPTHTLMLHILSFDSAVSPFFAPCIMSQWLAKNIEFITLVLPAVYESLIAIEDSRVLQVLQSLSMWVQKPAARHLEKHLQSLFLDNDHLRSLSNRGEAMQQSILELQTSARGAIIT